jgi:hypothetical protein
MFDPTLSVLASTDLESVCLQVLGVVDFDSDIVLGDQSCEAVHFVHTRQGLKNQSHIGDGSPQRTHRVPIVIKRHLET